MAATIIALADAVASLLTTAAQAGTFEREFRADRLTMPVYQLRDMGILKVSVVPHGRVTELETRGHLLREGHSLDVGFQMRLTDLGGSPDPADVDALLLLVEGVGDYLLKTSVSSPNARALTLENDPVYDPVHMDEWRQFTSVLTVTYKLWRQA